MNDHVVNGEELRAFMQNEYDFSVGIHDVIHVEDDKRRQDTKDYFFKMSKKFKVVLDLHD